MRSGLYKKKPKNLLSWLRKQIPFLSSRFEAFEFVLHFWELFFLILSKASRMLGRNYLLKPKQSPNCLQMHEETTLKHVPIRIFYPALPLRFRRAPLIIVVDPTFLIVLAFILQPARHHTIGSSFLTWEPWETTVLGKCYTQTFQFGIKYKYLDMSSPFIFTLSNFCMGSIIFHWRCQPQITRRS